MDDDCGFRVEESDNLRDTWVKGFGRLVALSYRLPITSTMPQTSLETTSRFKYQSIFDSALRGYEKKTGNNLTKDPLFRSLETCDSPDAVLTILRAQLLGPGQSQSNSDNSTAWLDPTVNFINVFSATIGGGVGLVSLMKIEVITLIRPLIFIF
jgi:hypothetical protein